MQKCVQGSRYLVTKVSWEWVQGVVIVETNLTGKCLESRCGWVQGSRYFRNTFSKEVFKKCVWIQDSGKVLK